MKRLACVLALIVIATSPASGTFGQPQFVGVRAYDIQVDSYIDEKGIYHNVVAPVLPGARAYVCTGDGCKWYTAGADGMAGVWLDWGTAFSVTPARPLGYSRCVAYSAPAFAGIVGATRILSEAVWTGWCSTPDGNICPVTGCSPQLTQ